MIESKYSTVRHYFTMMHEWMSGYALGLPFNEILFIERSEKTISRKQSHFWFWKKRCCNTISQIGFYVGNLSLVTAMHEQTVRQEFDNTCTCIYFIHQSSPIIVFCRVGGGVEIMIPYMAVKQYETLTGKLAEVLRIRQSAAPTAREQVTVWGQHTPCQNTPNIKTIYQKYCA